MHGAREGRSHRRRLDSCQTPRPDHAHRDANVGGNDPSRDRLAVSRWLTSAESDSRVLVLFWTDIQWRHTTTKSQKGWACSSIAGGLAGLSISRHWCWNQRAYADFGTLFVPRAMTSVCSPRQEITGEEGASMTTDRGRCSCACRMFGRRARLFATVLLGTAALCSSAEAGELPSRIAYIDDHAHALYTVVPRNPLSAHLYLRHRFPALAELVAERTDPGVFCVGRRARLPLGEDRARKPRGPRNR